MKRALAIFSALLLCAGLAACSQPASNLDDPKIVELEFDPVDDLAKETGGLSDLLNESVNKIIGYSPDGKTAFICSTITGIHVLPVDSEDAEPVMCTVTPMEVMLQAKRPEWSKDGKTFVLVDNPIYGRELVMGISTNIELFRYQNGDLDSERVTNEDTKKKITDGGGLLCSAMLSADDKSIVYIKYTSGKVTVYKAGVNGTDAEKLLSSSSDNRINECLELKTGLLLGTTYNNKQEPSELFLYDTGNDEKTEIDNDLLDADEKGIMFDICGWSQDRRTVLVERWMPLRDENNAQMGQCISDFYILRFDGSFRSLEIDRLAFDSDQTQEQHREAQHAVLSKDVRYLASYEMETDSSNGTSLREVVLYDLEKKKMSVVESSDEPLMFPVTPLNGSNQAFFFTNDKRLIVHYMEEIRVYKLG